MAMNQFDARLLEVKLNSSAIKQKAKQLKEIVSWLDLESKIQDLLLAINCIDLTTLGGDDTASNVSRLCWRASNPLSRPIIDKLKISAPVTTAAVCVYPLRVSDAKRSFDTFKCSLPIASVVAGFPAGQGTAQSVLDEINFATDSGATEIDIVINRTLPLTGQWHQLFVEIAQAVQRCKECNAHLKVILSTGELTSLDNVYKASMCAMMAGCDFIKTSTGKESINAKLVYGLTMCRAIRDYFLVSGRRVGLKPAGGLKDADDALAWIELMRSQLGTEWLNNHLFRIGASSLLGNIEAELFRLTYGERATPSQLSF